jgi:hypothetical protein
MRASWWEEELQIAGTESEVAAQVVVKVWA